MPNRYPYVIGGCQNCTQGETPVKATNGKSMKMLTCKFAWISVLAARTMQTAEQRYAFLNLRVGEETKFRKVQ